MELGVGQLGALVEPFRLALQLVSRCCLCVEGATALLGGGATAVRREAMFGRMLPLRSPGSRSAAGWSRHHF